MQSGGHFRKLLLESVDILVSASNQMFSQLYQSCEQFYVSKNMWTWALRSTGRLIVELQRAVEGPGACICAWWKRYKKILKCPRDRRMSTGGIQADAWLISLYQSISKSELQHSDFILTGPRWKTQQHQKATTSDMYSPMVWERMSCKGGLKVSVK